MVEKAALPRSSPVARLEAKFVEWFKLQPEWVEITVLPRQQRRAMMRELAARLYSVPIEDGFNTVPKQVRRKAAKALAHAVKTEAITEMVSEALLEAARREALVAEAEASVALDGETIAVTTIPGPEENEYHYPPDPEPDDLPDPEGDAKDDVEAGKQALVDAVMEGGEGDPKVAFIETDEETEEAPALD
jgi:hypothetical protein